jgi:fucose permease
VDKFGYKWLLIIGTLLALAGVQGLANFTSINALHASILMLGIGGGILNGETNALVAEIYDDEHRGARLSVLGAFYCIGALLWTLLNYFKPTDYTVPLNSVSAVIVVFVLFFLIIQFPKAKPQGSVSLKKSLGLLKYPSLILFAFLLFFQSGFEGITGSFTPQFIQLSGGTAGAATLSLTWFTIGMLIGRFVLGYAMKKLKDNPTLYLYLTIALVGVAILYFAVSNAILVYLATALIGWGVGATYPVVFNYLGATFKENSGTAFSIAIFIALWGQFAFNKLAGIFFDQGHPTYFPVILASTVVAMMILLPIAQKKR